MAKASSKKTIKGVEYSFSKIDARKQFHIIRRVGTLINELTSAFSKINFADIESIKSINPLEALAPIAKTLSKMSDKKADYVIFGLLDSVEMKQATGGYAKVNNGTHIMFEDVITMDMMLILAAQAMVENYASFFAAAVSALPEGSLKQNTP
jgi:hypothetical protein